MRFTLAGLMIVVAAVGFALGRWAMWRRANRFRELAVDHSRLAARNIVRLWITDPGRGLYSDPIPTPIGEYHAKTARKYADAASRPWLDVEPDPLPPPSFSD